MIYVRRVTLLLWVLLLSSCADTGAAYSADGPGFWMGLWHGFIVIFALIGHLFDSSIRVYASPNNGAWYDFGFVLGAILWCSSGNRKSEYKATKRYNDESLRV
jgi:hypothetical protein